MEQQSKTRQEAQQESVHQGEWQMESVLFVDPESDMHEQMEQMLQDLFVLRHARTAREAWDALGRQLPGLMISEVDLPDQNGLELCEQVRANQAAAGLPILLLTTRAGIGDKVAGFMAGADDYVVKPIDPRFFSARVRLLFRLKALDQRPSQQGTLSPPPSPSSPPPQPEDFQGE
ncbi:MAG TPA: response regulator transcription factor [Ktedonobacterales bacterium]|jgi:DNA-binding response OmpR family regulator